MMDKGTHRLQGPRARWPLLLGLLFSFYFLLSSPSLSLSLLCLLSVPHGCSPLLTFSCAFRLHLPLQRPLSLPLFFLLPVTFSMWRESCPGNPSFLQLWRKRLAPGDKLFLLSVETSRLIFPSQEQNTKGYWPNQWISRMSVRSLLFIFIHSVWNTQGASLDPPLT